MVRENKWLIIPIETKNREFHSKLLLSCFAAEAGYGVILGHKNVIRGRTDLLPKGIVIEKSAETHILDNIIKYRDYGHVVTAWCEEGLLYHNADTYISRRVNEHSLELMEKFFSWGEVGRLDILARYPNAQNKIIATGNPRVDLLRPELRSVYKQDILKIKSRFKDKIILVNTNFELYNTNANLDMISIMKSLDKLNYDGAEEFYLGWRNYKRDLMYEFLNMVKQIAHDFAGVDIVIRPHPSENHAPYKALADQIRNVVVNGTDNVVVWLLAADVVIHNSCTTGIEAFLAGKTVFSYQPFKSKKYDLNLANQLGRSVKDYEELKRCLQSILHEENKSSADNHRKKEIAQEYISNINNDFACEKIMRIMDSISQESAAFASSIEFSSSFKNYPKNIWKFLRSRFINIKRNNGMAAYAKQKFPGIEIDEVRSMINKYQLALNRFDLVEPIKFVDNCFVIKRR